MSLTTQPFNASNHSLSLSHDMLMQQNIDAERLLAEGEVESKSDFIDYSVERNRLYKNFDGTIAIAEKPLGYVIGEQVVAPVIDRIASVITLIRDFSVSGWRYMNSMLTFPGAYADESCAPTFTSCHTWKFETHVETQWVTALTYNQKVSNTGRDHQRLIYNPPGGWAIRDYRVEEYVKFGHSGYTIQKVAGGSNFVSRKEVEKKFDAEISGSDGDKQYHLKEKRDDYLREYDQIKASDQTLILDATAEGVGIFQGGGRLHVDVKVELFRVNYMRTIYEIDSVCRVSNAVFDKDSCYEISFNNDDDGQAGWVLTAHRHYDKDKRNDDSTYAIIHKPWPGPHVWKIITEDSGKTFQIFLANRDAGEQAGWFLVAHGIYDKDRRNDGSAYALVHKPGYEIRHWKIIKQGGTYTISLANNAYLQSGWYLSAHRHYNMDKRNDGSTYAIVHTPGFGGRDWKIEEVPC